MPIMTENKKTKIMMAQPDKLRKIWSEKSVVYSSGNICYYHIASGNVIPIEIDEGDPCIPYKNGTPTLSGWQFVGWRKDTAANPTVLGNGSVVMGEEPIHLYAVFRQTVTISYAGNGNTGGSTASQSAYRYYNNGAVANPSFVLRACGFTKTGYVFSTWTSGGRNYSAGQTITASGNMTMTASYLPEEEPTTWDKTKVYPWPWKHWTGYKYVWSDFLTDATAEEIAEAKRCWNSSVWIEADGDHSGNYTNCLKAYVDCSKYRGIKVPLHVMLNTYNDDKGALNLYLSGGGTTNLIESVPGDTYGPNVTKTYTLLFTQTSGLTNVLIHNTRPTDSRYTKGTAEVAGNPILLRRGG